MSKLTNTQLKLLAKYIYNNFDKKNMTIDEYLASSLSEISTKVQVEEDSLIDFFDFHQNIEKIDHFFNKILIPYIKSYDVPRIEVIQDNIDWIIKTLYSRNSNTKNDLLTRINMLLNSAENKGNVYEELCVCFLQDVGFDAHKTKRKEDFGIDIFAKFKSFYSTEYLFLASPFSQYPSLMLAQAKCLEKPVDVPLVRNLISDSIFYRFKGKSYCQFDLMSPIFLVFFSHNGYGKNALEFARKHGVIALSSEDMADILSCAENPDHLHSIKYLNSL